MNETNPYESPKHAPAEATLDSPSNGDREHGATKNWVGADFKFALAQQGVLLVFTALLLDGGYFLAICCTAVIAYWAALMLMALRRRRSPAKSDLSFVKFGFLICFGLTTFAAFVVQVAREFL